MTDDDWVRRLLARAGEADEPMPRDVADRLDRVVADLSTQRAAERSGPLHGSEESAADDAAPVVPMTPRRHRRWGAALLAAAAVVVGGYSVAATGLLDQVGGSTSGDDAGAAADAQAESSEGGSVADEGGAESAPQAGSGAVSGLPTLSSSTLQRDAAALVGDLRVRDAAKTGAQAQPGPEAESQSDARDGALRDAEPLTGLRDCVPPPARGRVLAVVLDGEPATAVVRSRDASGSVVQVWSCRSPVQLAEAIVKPTGR